MNIKTQVEIYGPVRRVPPGRAKGLKAPLMRARGERGTESRLPKKRPPRSKKEYVHVLQDLVEPAIKTPVGFIKPVTLPWSKK